LVFHGNSMEDFRKGVKRIIAATELTVEDQYLSKCS